MGYNHDVPVSPRYTQSGNIKILTKLKNINQFENVYLKYCHVRLNKIIQPSGSSCELNSNHISYTIQQRQLNKYQMDKTIITF